MVIAVSGVSSSSSGGRRDYMQYRHECLLVVISHFLQGNQKSKIAVNNVKKCVCLFGFLALLLAGRNEETCQSSEQSCHW